MSKEFNIEDSDLKDFKIESFLKKEFKENDNIEVPNDIHLALKNVLKELPQKRKLHKIRKTLIAASVTGIVFVWTAFTFPAFAESLPVFGDFFKSINENIRYKNFVDEVEKNSKDIIGKVSDNNLEITLMTAVPDSTGITIGYYIKSLDGKLEMPQLWDCSVEIDGVTYEPTIENIIQEDKEEGFYQISNLVLPDLPEKFDYKINLKNITDVEGNWSFNGNLDKTDIDNQTTVKSLNIIKDTAIGKIEVKSVTKSPLYLKIEYIDYSHRGRVSFDPNYEENLDTRYNNYYEIPGVKDTWGHMSTRVDNDGLTTVLYTGFNKDFNYIDIIPIINYRGDPNVVEINPKDSIGLDIYNGKHGTITLTDYKEESGDKFIRLKIKPSDVNMYVPLYDKLKSGEKVNSYGYIIKREWLINDKNVEEEIQSGNEVWLKYNGKKLYIDGDRENSYTKEDKENIIRIEF